MLPSDFRFLGAGGVVRRGEWEVVVMLDRVFQPNLCDFYIYSAVRVREAFNKV